MELDVSLMIYHHYYLTIHLNNPNSFPSGERRLVCSSPQSRTGERVARRVVVQVEQNTRIVPLVKRCPGHTVCRSNRTAAGNLDVQALRIELGAIVAAPAMQRNDFVANNVVASLKVLRNDRGGGEAVLDEVVRSPCTRATGGYEASLGELGPSEGGWAEGSAFA
jgi:hypothetical protein